MQPAPHLPTPCNTHTHSHPGIYTGMLINMCTLMRTRACVGFKRSFAAANMLIYFDTNALRYKILYTLTRTQAHARTNSFVCIAHMLTTHWCAYKFIIIRKPKRNAQIRVEFLKFASSENEIEPIVFHTHTRTLLHTHIHINGHTEPKQSSPLTFFRHFSL